MAGQIKGISTVVRNLNREIKNIKGRSLNGLIRAAIYIRRRMEEVPPLIPVDTGNMRSSWFVQPFFTSKGPAVRLGFTAEYAWEVHEKVGAHFKRPGAGAKFLQTPLVRDQRQILKIIASEAQIK